MIQQTVSAAEEVLAYHRAKKNKPLFAAELIGTSRIHSFDQLLGIYHDLVKTGLMEAAEEARTVDPATRKTTGYVGLYRLKAALADGGCDHAAS
jgi:hypothetical protein